MKLKFTSKIYVENNKRDTNKNEKVTPIGIFSFDKANWNEIKQIMRIVNINIIYQMTISTNDKMELLTNEIVIVCTDARVPLRRNSKLHQYPKKEEDSKEKGGILSSNSIKRTTKIPKKLIKG